MCLNPIQLYNPSKYINIHHGDPFKLVVPCNHCAECQSLKRYEWYFRMDSEFKACLKNGGFVLFETLTYNDDYLPHIGDFIDNGITENFSCFNRTHIRYFLVKLRRMLSYRGLPSIRYFLSAEYGHDNLYSDNRGRVRKGTNRPHYHLLFFCDSAIDPIQLSRWIYQCWKFGATDWSNNGDDYMLKKRVFKDYSLHGMRLANYVAKYVQKDSEFDSKINERINVVLDNSFLTNNLFSIAEKYSMRIKLKNMMSQFHLQSKGFGLQYLDSEDFNMDELFRTGMFKFVVPDNPNLYKTIPIPMYYQRHLFQRQIYVDGKRVWENTELGVKYKEMSEDRKRKNMLNRFNSWLMNVGKLYDRNVSDFIYSIFDKVDLPSLVEYVLFMRYRFLSHVDYAPLSKRLEDISFYHYGTMNDLLVYGKKFITNRWLGNDIIGYDELPDVVYSREVFASSFTYIDSHLEYAYQVYLNAQRLLSPDKQKTFDFRQRMENLYNRMFCEI